MEKLPMGRAGSSGELLHLALKGRWRVDLLPVQAWAPGTSTVERTLTELRFLPHQPYHSFLPQWGRKYKASALITLNWSSPLPIWKSLVLLSISWCQHLPYLTPYILTNCLFIPASALCPFLALCWVLAPATHVSRFPTPLPPV